MKKRRSRRLNYQSLEPRQVLAANPLLTLDAGTLTIEGSDSSDKVEVSYNNGQIQVDYNSNNQFVGTEQFDASAVDDIRFLGRNGDDSFVNRTDVSVVAYGNQGNDRLVGGSNDDVLRGCLLYTSPSPRDQRGSRMPSSA